MQLIQIPKKGNTTITMVFSNAGARFEDNSIKGISHFVEHLCFKETKSRTQKEIALGIEKCGGVLNAFTDWEITAYWTKVANKYKKQSLDITQDLVTNPVFPKEEISKERKVILQELKMYEDNPSTQVYDYLNKKLYNKDSGFYLPIIGTEKSLTHINKEILEEYHKKKYEHLTLIQVGDVKENEIYVPEKKIIVPEEIKKYKRNKFLFKRKDIKQANITIANYVNLANIPKLDRLIIFNLLGAIYNDMSGRLFQTIREQNNLVYRIHFYFDIFSCGGVQWRVTLGLDKTKITKAYNLIIKELNKPITKQELTYAITKLSGQKDIALDNPLNIVSTVAYSIRKGIDWKERIYNYHKNYERVGHLINDYQKIIDFKENILVGVIPE